MTFPKARLFVSACLLVAWLGFLLFLVIDSRKVVLSKPQFMAADEYVVAEIRDEGGKPGPNVSVSQYLWTSLVKDQAPNQLNVLDLPECGESEGYRGPGKYLLPLNSTGVGIGLGMGPTRKRTIVPLPRRGGREMGDEKRIYPWTPDVEAQVQHLVDAKK